MNGHGHAGEECWGLSHCKGQAAGPCSRPRLRSVLRTEAAPRARLAGLQTAMRAPLGPGLGVGGLPGERRTAIARVLFCDGLGPWPALRRQTRVPGGWRGRRCSFAGPGPPGPSPGSVANLLITGNRGPGRFSSSMRKLLRLCLSSADACSGGGIACVLQELERPMRIAEVIGTVGRCRASTRR